jgi:hypothetical protein
MTAKLTVRQEVPVRTPHGSYTGVVTRVGRKIATIYYNGRHAEFDMATRRQKIKQVGTGYYYELPDSDPTPDLTPGQRLVKARWNLRQIAEGWLSEPEPPAGSPEARVLYASLTSAARELAAAQDALDAAWEAG